MDGIARDDSMQSQQDIQNKLVVPLETIIAKFVTAIDPEGKNFLLWLYIYVYIQGKKKLIHIFFSVVVGTSGGIPSNEVTAASKSFSYASILKSFYLD